MKRPPVVPGSISRGLAPFRGRRAAALLPRTRLGGPMPWVIAIMVALTVLAAGGGLSLRNLANTAEGDLAGRVTVQVLEADPARRNLSARRAAAILRNDPSVRSVEPVPQADVEALLAPWLGGGGMPEAVPLPALIDLRLRAAADPATVARLGDAIAEVAPSARVDAQSTWLAPVLGALKTLRLSAFALIALLAFTAAAAVWLAARNALGANRPLIEIVHLLGGSDNQIARIFQRSILFDAASGGLLGLIAGGLGVRAMGAQFARLDSGFVAGGTLSTGDWVLLACIPLAGVMLAVLIARMTVLASLRRML